MDQQTYVLLSVILIILRIIITVYCINRAEVLQRSKLGWGFFGFILPLLALIWIQFVKSKDKVLNPISQEAKIISDNSTTIKSNPEIIDKLEVDDLEILNQQIRSLKKIKNEGLLSEIEFNEKYNTLKIKEKSLFDSKMELEILHKRQRFENTVNHEIQPIVDELEKLKNSGLLSDKEFKEKKEKLFNEKKAELLDNPLKKIHFTELIEWKKRAIRDLFLKNPNNKVFLNKKSDGNYFCSLSQEEFNNLKLTEDYKNYFFVVLPKDFDPKKIK